MQPDNQSQSAALPLRWILLAGIVGGLAEVVWVELLTSSQDVNILALMRGITHTVLPAVNDPTACLLFGLTVHFALSLTIAGGFAVFLWRPALRQLGRGGVVVVSMLSLIAVWLISYYGIMRWLDPEFLALIPPAATLVSKLFFGFGMGLVLADPLATRGLETAVAGPGRRGHLHPLH